MTFRNKILLSIWSVVLSLLVITFFIINYWTRNRVENTFTNELRANYSTIRELTRLQSETLIRSCRVIAESPRLRAVAELDDPATAYELSRELSSTTLSSLFVLTDRNGASLACLVQGQNSRIDVTMRKSIRDAMAHASTTDVWELQNTAYRIVSTPILLDTELIGTLTMGFRVTGGDLATLKQATNSDVILVLNGAATVSTLDASAASTLVAASGSSAEEGSPGDTAVRVITLRIPEETYLGTTFRLNKKDFMEDARADYLIVKPFSREVGQFMGSILRTFGIISLVFLALTSIIGRVISRGMTKPITDLVEGTAEVSRGNYDYAIHVRGSDEISFLGMKFMEMSRSLKEKMGQLDKLNNDLVERNANLDETLRRLREAQQELVQNERLAATGKMTAQLAHEINNPLHNIQSCLQTSLKRLPADFRGRDLIEVAFDEVNRMSRLTRQMLEIYRSSYVEVQFSPTQIGEVVQETIAATTEELARSGISLHTDVDPQLPNITGSKDKLKQVFLNLILNAVDAMPHGGSLSLVADRKDGHVRVMVQDSGIGIPKENLSRIFEPFFTTKDKVSGVGLGLSVCYGIVTQHNGTITVSSEPGRGSVFTVTLPIQQQHAGENGSPREEMQEKD